MLYNIKNIPNDTTILEVKEWKDISIVSEPIVLSDVQSPDFEKLIWSMIKTCIENNGIGLAAAQIGTFKQIFICQRFDKKKNKYSDLFELYINPSYKVYKNDGYSTATEGCLSVPGEEFDIERANSIMARWYIVERRKEVKVLSPKIEKLVGRTARCFQHEHDHLIGLSIPKVYDEQSL
jgi:peptide deformylase